MLALLLDRLSGRPSFSPAPTINASLLALLILRRTIIFPEPSSLHRRRWKLWTALPTAVFLVSTCGYNSKVIEPPHCRANTVTRASSSPELRDQSSTFTGVPPFTRASSSPELCD